MCSNSCNSTLFFIAQSISPHSESLDPTKCIWKLTASAVPSVVCILQLSMQSAQVSCFSLFDWKGCHGFGWIIADIINHNYKTLKVPVKRASKLKYSNLRVLSLKSVIPGHKNDYESDMLV